MTVPLLTIVTETFQDREASLKGQSFERSYTRKFWVTANIITDQQFIMLAFGVPRLGDIYFTTKGGLDAGSWCQEVVARQRNASPLEWEVVARYSSRVDANSAFIQNPLLRPTIIVPSTKKYPTPIDYAINGAVIQNVVDDKFDPPLMGVNANLVLTITRNMAVIDFLALRDYQQCINEFAYLGFPEETLLVEDISATPESENGINFWKVTVILECASTNQPNNDFTWRKKILHCGYNELVGGVKRPILLPGGARPSTPQLLDAAGVKLAVGAAPVWIMADVYPLLDFALLTLF